MSIAMSMKTYSIFILLFSYYLIGIKNEENTTKMESFDEWKTKMLQEHGITKQPATNTNQTITRWQRGKNYASTECAKVVDANPEAEGVSRVVNEMMDEYMLNPCKAKIWFVIELCDAIQATQIELANLELFSSTPKELTVYSSESYPTTDWNLIGQFTAADTRNLQTFDLEQKGFSKYVKMEMHSHYGTNYYCPLSIVRIYGKSMVEEDSTDKSASNHSRVIWKQESKFDIYFKVMLGERASASICTDKDCGKPINSFPNVSQTTNSIASQTPPVAPNPQKESVFVRLSQRVRILELNVSLSSQYLEELSQRYRRQIDDLEKKLFAAINNLNRIESKLEENTDYHWRVTLILFVVNGIILLSIIGMIFVLRYYVKLLMKMIDM